MATSGEPIEPRRQIVWSLYWLAATIGIAFMAGCVFDAGIIFALPLIAIVSAAWWIALTIIGMRVAGRERGDRRRGWPTAAASIVALAIALLVFLPVMRASGFVQAQGVLAFNQRDWERDIKRTTAKGRVREPLTWSYGGFLSTERVIAFWPSGDPTRRLAKPIGAGTSAYCRWLRSSFYDCTIDY